MAVAVLEVVQLPVAELKLEQVQVVLVLYQLLVQVVEILSLLL